MEPLFIALSNAPFLGKQSYAACLTELLDNNNATYNTKQEGDVTHFFIQPTIAVSFILIKLLGDALFLQHKLNK